MNPLLHTKGKGLWRRGSSQEETQQLSFNGNMPPSKAAASTQGLMSSQDENQQSSNRESKPYSEAALSDTARIDCSSQGDIQSARPRQRKILIFGETGAGKSSVVNMLAENEVSRSSPDAIGSMAEIQRYEFSVASHAICVYDTVGLGEALQGTVPLPQALAMLFKLIRDLADSDGIDFLIIVARGPRVLMDRMAKYYKLFFETLCQRQVPIVAVITGLEYEKDWWERNKVEFSKHGMVFNGHACVTAIKGKETRDGYLLQEEYDVSKKTLKDLVSSCCQRDEPWKQDTDIWFQSTLGGYLRNYLTSFTDALINKATDERVIRKALMKHASLKKPQAMVIAVKIVSTLEKDFDH